MWKNPCNKRQTRSGPARDPATSLPANRRCRIMCRSPVLGVRIWVGLPSWIQDTAVLLHRPSIARRCLCSDISCRLFHCEGPPTLTTAMHVTLLLAADFCIRAAEDPIGPAHLEDTRSLSVIRKHLHPWSIGSPSWVDGAESSAHRI